jgi:hypothetical protein
LDIQTHQETSTGLFPLPNGWIRGIDGNCYQRGGFAKNKKANFAKYITEYYIRY